MFRQLALATVAAAAFSAAPASAATFLLVSNSSPLTCTGADATCNFMISGEVDTNGPFSLVSNIFTLPGLGTFSGSATNSASAGTNIDFTSVLLTNLTTSTGYVGTVSNTGVFSIALSGPDSISGGNFTLTLGGSALINPGPPASFPGIGGSAVFDAAPAVPEPGTWALFILGFGAMGFAMRRRNAQVTATKATLNFA